MAYFRTALILSNHGAAHMDSVSHPEYDAVQVMMRLIGMGLVKGYVAVERDFLVLSQKDPFPRMLNTEEKTWMDSGMEYTFS